MGKLHRTLALFSLACVLSLGCAKFNDSCPVTNPEVWGEIGVDLDIRREYIRQCEAPVGNFLADALLNFDYGLKYEGQDVVVRMALFNAGAIRDKVTCGELGDTRERIPQGPITDQDIYQLVPFYEDSIVVVRMPISSLKKVLERSVSSLGLEGQEGQEGHFLQVAGQLGVRIEVDCGAQAQTLDTSGMSIVEEGARITGLYLGNSGNMLVDEPDAIIYVATLDYVVGVNDEGVPNDGFVGFHDEGVQVLETYLPIIDVIRPWVADYATEYGMDPTSYPAAEDRLDYQASCSDLEICGE